MDVMQPFGLEIDGRGNRVDELAAQHNLRALVQQHGLVLIRQAHIESEEASLVAFAGRVAGADGELLAWDFGQVMNLRHVPGHQNYLFSRETIPYHWDGAFHRVPSILVFQCLQAESAPAGGETFFCDTRRIRKKLNAEWSLRWSNAQLRYSTERLAHYGGEFTEPLFSRHPHTGEDRLRIAEPVMTEKNPVAVELVGEARGREDDLWSSLRPWLYDPAMQYVHRWQQGDLLLADNHSLLHGRRPLTGMANRHLRRVQIL